MLCRQRPAQPMEDSNEAIHAIRSFPMSMTSTVRLIGPDGPTRDVHQSRSSLAAWRDKLHLWFERRHWRKLLRAHVDDERPLPDVGLTRGAVLREANKPFWR